MESISGVGQPRFSGSHLGVTNASSLSGHGEVGGISSAAGARRYVCLAGSSAVEHVLHAKTIATLSNKAFVRKTLLDTEHAAVVKNAIETNKSQAESAKQLSRRT